MILELLALAWIGIFAYQDYKTGYVNDRQAFLLILIGAIYSFIINPFALIVAGVVALLGFLFYYFGQLGGGDIQVFVIISLFFHRTLFYLPLVAWVFVVAVILSSILIPASYLLRLGEKKKVFGAFIPAVAFLPLFPLVVVFYLVLVFQLLLLRYKKEIMEKFVIKNKPVDKLTYEDVIAIEYVDKRKELGLWKRVLLPHELKRFKQKAKELGIKKVLVYENLPKFVPYIFISLILCYLLALFG
jgi:Flp pilus assembly protein protease CpaA